MQVHKEKRKAAKESKKAAKAAANQQHLAYFDKGAGSVQQMLNQLMSMKGGKDPRGKGKTIDKKGRGKGQDNKPRNSGKGPCFRARDNNANATLSTGGPNSLRSRIRRMEVSSSQAIRFFDPWIISPIG